MSKPRFRIALAACIAVLLLSGAGSCQDLADLNVTPGSATANSIYNFTVTWTEKDGKWPAGQQITLTGVPVIEADDQGNQFYQKVLVNPPDPTVLPPNIPLWDGVISAGAVVHGSYGVVKVYDDADASRADKFDHELGRIYMDESTQPPTPGIDLGRQVTIDKDAGPPASMTILFCLPGYVCQELVQMQASNSYGDIFFLSHTPIEHVVDLYGVRAQTQRTYRATIVSQVTGAVSPVYEGGTPAAQRFEVGDWALVTYWLGPIVLELDRASSYARVAEPYDDGNANGKYDPGETYTDRNGNGQWDPAEVLGSRPGFAMGYVEGNPRTGAKFRVRVSAGLNLANDPTAVPGINYAKGLVGRNSSPWYQTCKRRAYTWVLDGPQGVASSQKNTGDFKDGPNVYGSRTPNYYRTSAYPEWYSGPLGEGVLQLVLVEGSNPDRVIVPRKPVSAVRGVYLNNSGWYSGSPSENYFDPESGATFESATGVLRLSKSLPFGTTSVWVLYSPRDYPYDTGTNQRWGGSGSGNDSLLLSVFGDSLVPEFNPADPNNPLKPYDDQYPDDGTSSTAFIFRVNYRNRANTWPVAWLPADASPGGLGGSSGVVLYLDRAGTGDYVPWFMRRANPISGEQPSVNPFVQYWYRMEPASGWAIWGGASTRAYFPLDNNYEALIPGRYHYFFGCSDDQFNDENGDPYENAKMVLYPSSFTYPPSSAYPYWYTRRANAVSNYWTEQHIPPYWPDTSYDMNQNSEGYEIQGVPNNYIMVDRPTLIPGVDIIEHSAELAAIRHPVVRPSLVGISPFEGSSLFLGTLSPYYRAVNPVYFYPNHGASAPISRNHSHQGAYEKGAETSGATTKTTLTFRVLYRSIRVGERGRADSTDGVPPVYVKVFINNASDAGRAGRDDGRGIYPPDPTDPHYYRGYTMSPAPNQLINASTLATGIVYQVQLNLPVGGHTYFFEAYDGFMYSRFPVRPDGRFIYEEGKNDAGNWYEDPWVPGDADLANNNDYFPGPYINTPCEILNAKVTPTSGPQGTDFEFSCTYRDADGQRPYSAIVEFDTGIGEQPIVSLQMKKKDPSKGTPDDYRAGITYAANTASLEGVVIKTGLRRFRFIFTDDWGRQSNPNDLVKGEVTRYPSDGGWINGPIIVDAPRPELIDGSVSSNDASATSATVWTYKVTYKHAGNLQPSYVKVFIGDRGTLRTTYTAQQLSPTDATHVIVPNKPVHTVAGVWTNAGATGTNYYSGGSFDPATGVITLGVSLPAGTTTVYVSYTAGVIEERATPTSATRVRVANIPVLSVLGVWTNPARTGTNYYRGDPPDALTGEIVLGIALDDPTKDVYVTYIADGIVWDAGHDMTKRDPADNLYTDGAVYQYSTRLSGADLGERVRQHVYAFEASDGNYLAAYKSSTSPSANCIAGDAEPYTDLNGNLRFTLLEYFTMRGNGHWDPGESYTDTNRNSRYDPAEPLVDLNCNNKWDPGETFTDRNGNGVWDDAEPFVDSLGNPFRTVPNTTEPFIDLNCNGKWDYCEPYTDLDGNGYFDQGDLFTITDDTNGSGYFERADPFTDVNQDGIRNAGGERLTKLDPRLFQFARRPVAGPIPVVGGAASKLLPDPIIYRNGANLDPDTYETVVVPPQSDRRSVCLRRGGVDPNFVLRVVSVKGSTPATQNIEYYDTKLQPGSYDRSTGLITLSGGSTPGPIPANVNAVVTYLRHGCYYMDYINGKAIFHPETTPADSDTMTADYWFAELGPTVGVNTPPVLSNGSVSPEDGAVGTEFVFRVTYSDVDGPRGQAPQFVRLYLDGTTWYDMSYAGTGTANYRTGALFEYSISDLAPGSHSYHFEASDGAAFGALDYNGSRTSDQPITGLVDFPGPYVGVPLLTNGEAKPNPPDGTIDSNQPVTYSVVYYNYEDTGRPDDGNPVVWIDNPSETSFVGLADISPSRPTVMRDITKRWPTGSGVWPDSLRGTFIQFLDGGAASKVYMIKSNTATELRLENPSDPTTELDLQVAGVRSGNRYRIGGLQMRRRNELVTPHYAPQIIPLNVGDSLKQLQVPSILGVTGIIHVYTTNPPAYPAIDYFEGGSFDYASGTIVLGRSLPTGTRRVYLWVGVGYQVTVPRFLRSEPFTDLDGDGVYDPGEPFTDLNANGQRDTHTFHFKSTTTVTQGGQTFTQEARYPRIGGTAGELIGPNVVEPPAGNSAPVLTASETRGVSPSHGKSTDVFTFSVYYSDSDNDPPAQHDGLTGYIRLKVDLESGGSCTYPMQRVGGIPGDYIRPALYAVEVPALPGSATCLALPGGVHRFHFEASDGYRSVRFPALRVDDLPVIVNRVPVLSLDGVQAVSPTLGNPGVQFTYQVLYTDADNNPPAYVRVQIFDGDVLKYDYPMAKVSVSNDFTRGIIYEKVLNPGELALLAGEPSRQFSFRFVARDYDAADAAFVGEEVQLPPAGTPPYAGPLVTASGAPVLSGGQVAPDSGGESTEFNFRVKYTDPDNDPPQYVRVYIDDQPRTCQLAGSPTYQTGAWYSYKTTLAAGSNHKYYFMASDWANVVTLLDVGGQPFSGPIVSYKPVLSRGSVTPDTGMAGDIFTFSVMYSDRDGVPPATGTGYVRAGVEGMADFIAMTPKDIGRPYTANDWKNGVVFEGKSTVPAGQPPTYDLTYFFEASDGFDYTRHDPPENLITVYTGKPYLRLPTGGALNRTTGTATTTFVYSIYYVDPNDLPPWWVYVVVDGNVRTMTQANPADRNYKEGVVFQYATKLPQAGVHRYRFGALTEAFGTITYYCKDDQNNDVECLGPTVTTSTLELSFDWDGKAQCVPPTAGQKLRVTVSLLPKLATTVNLKIVKQNMDIDRYDIVMKSADQGRVTKEITLDSAGNWRFEAYWPGVTNVYDAAEATSTLSIAGSTLQIKVNGIYLMSPPVEPLYGSIDGLLTSDVAAALRVTRWDPIAGKYQVYSRGSTFPRIAVGDAFWIKPTADVKNLLEPAGRTYTLERVRATDTRQIRVANRPIQSVCGVWTDPTGAGTNYYTGGSFVASTGVITPGILLPEQSMDVYVTYTVPVPDTVILTVNGETPQQDDVLSVPIFPGWNQVGHGFATAARWADVRLLYNGTIYTLTQAKDLKLMRDYGWLWDSERAAYALIHATRAGAQRLLPTWSGCWVRSFVTGTLLFYPNPGAATRGGIAATGLAGPSGADDIGILGDDDYPPPVSFGE